MILKDFRQLFSKNIKKNLIISVIVAFFFSLLSLYFPKSFVTEGTFILIPNFQSSKNIDNKNIYNYDGYYLDQISQSYSKTILGLIETPEFKKKISIDLKSENNLRSNFLLNLNTNFREIAPRVLVLNVKADSIQNAEKMFAVYEKNILVFAEKYNSEKVFRLERLDRETNSFENTVSPIIYFIIAFFFTSFILISINFIKEFNYE